MSLNKSGWFIKQVNDALKLRWNKRNNIGYIMCGPQDVEIIEEGIASGADICATDQDYVRLEAKAEAARRIFSKAAQNLVSKFQGVSQEDLETALNRLLWRLRDSNREVRRIEHAKEAKNDLEKLAEKSYELAIIMLKIGEGAKEVMNRNRYKINGTDINGNPLSGSVSIPEWQELKENGDLFNEQSSEDLDEMSFTPPQRFLDESEAYTFPWVIPYEPNHYEDDEGLYDYEWSLGGPWIIRLRALAALASVNAAHLEKITGKGGRKNLGARLHGSPQDCLAVECRKYAESHGCHSQAVVLKMVQAVLEAEHGKEAMRGIDGKPAIHKGRKAVRKVAQTIRKPGTV